MNTSDMGEDFGYSDSHEEYVSFETAGLLKQAGFEWSTNKAFDIKGNSAVRRLTNWNTNDEYKDWCFAAPTLSVAQKWLREVKGMHITIDFTFITEQYIVSIHWCTNDASKDEYHNEHTEVVTSTFNTYEEALEAGVKKCLTLLLEGK